jgi:uncharacterized membrane protein YkoI
MKQIIILLVAVLCFNNSKAGDKKKVNVPANATAAFNKEYGAATKVKWEKEAGNYEASFTKGTNKMSAVYDNNGNKLESEVSIPLSKLPEAARKYAEAKGKIKDAAEITKADGTMVYEAEVNGMDLIFDKAGKFIKESKD